MSATAGATRAPRGGEAALLTVEDLAVEFGRHRRPALRGVSFTLQHGERLGLIGESGSGKSVTALAIMGLLPETAHVRGSIRLDGHEIVGAKERELAALRGDVATMVFQEPMTALDPTMKVGRQVGEVVSIHGRRGQPTRERVLAALDAVGLPDPERVANAYPHELSGGQRQRVVLAMALINRPDLVLCDEPTTALDVTVQARVLTVLDEALSERGAACLFISHDLAVVAQVCARALVMLDGRVVEQGPMAQLLQRPEHPYTRGLVATANIGAVAPGKRLPVVADFWKGER